MACILRVRSSHSSRPSRWTGIESSIIGMYFSLIILRKFSTFPSSAVRVIFFFSRRGLSAQMTRCISIHSQRIRDSVISVHRVESSVGGFGLSSSSSSTFRGNLVSNSLFRIPGFGPWASQVRMSMKHNWYQIMRRTCVSTGPRLYSVPSRCNPMHCAMRIPVPHRAECERETSARQSGIYLESVNEKRR